MSRAAAHDADELRRQIAATQARFTDIGVRLARAADAAAATGTPPGEELERELLDASQEFQALRAAVLDAAAALEVVPAKASEEAIVSLRDLGPLLESVARASAQAARRRRLDAARGGAFVVLDRVPAIVHRDDPRFAPLAECQANARALRERIEAAEGDDPEAEAAAWTAAVEPFATLLTMLDRRRTIDDEQWTELEDVIDAAFGRALAIAATRGKLLVR